MTDTPLRGQRILIAEDNALIAIAFHDILKRAGAEVVGGALADRFPKLCLAVSADDLAWLPNPAFRGVESLPVRSN